MPILALGCSGNEANDNPKENKEPKEETRLVTHVVTVEELAPTKTAGEQDMVLEPTPPEPLKKQGALQEDSSKGNSPENVLALQYEYINRGDFQSAYSLFANQSRQEVSFNRYRSFFEANAPYSVTDYSFPSVQVQGNSATVDAAFTVNSAGGVEDLQRTQQLVREDGEWRVVMRPEQIAAFTATNDAADTEPAPTPSSDRKSLPKEESADAEEEGSGGGGSSGGFTLSGSGQTATEPFELESGLSIFRISYQGERYFSVWLFANDGERVELLASEIGSFSGSKAVQVPRDGTYLLQVEAEGPWTIQVEP